MNSVEKVTSGITDGGGGGELGGGGGENWGRAWGRFSQL